MAERLNSLCVSQLFARRLRVPLGPAVAAHAPPARAGTVDLEHMARRHEAHWRGGAERERKEESFFFRTDGVWACADNEGSVFTWKGGVDLHARQARELILSPRAVVLPVAGLLQRDEPHRSLAEEILAVDQLLDCGGKEREGQRSRQRWGQT